MCKKQRKTPWKQIHETKSLRAINYLKDDMNEYCVQLIFSGRQNGPSGIEK